MKDKQEIIKELNNKLPMQFAVVCTVCKQAKKVRKDVFLTRVEKVNGNYEMLMNKYVCAACRKSKNIDLIGNKKVAGGSTKVITIEDLK